MRAALGLLVAAALPSLSASKPTFLSYFPNSDKVPLYDGTGNCERVGHVNCGASSGGGNSFGKLVKYTSAAEWSNSICIQDPDGDGRTNGDELGDPCCVWNGGAPQYTADISHPASAASTTSRPSCKVQAVMGSTLASAKVTDSGLKLTWTKPDSCICGYMLSWTPGSAAVTLDKDDTSHVVTDLAAGTSYTFALTPVNLHGDGTPAEHVVSTAATGAGETTRPTQNPNKAPTKAPTQTPTKAPTSIPPTAVGPEYSSASTSAPWTWASAALWGGLGLCLGWA